MIFASTADCPCGLIFELQPKDSPQVSATLEHGREILWGRKGNINATQILGTVFHYDKAEIQSSDLKSLIVELSSFTGHKIGLRSDNIISEKEL